MTPARASAAPLLRPAAQDDGPALAAFAARSYVETFVEGFGIAYAPEDLAAYLDHACSPAAFAAMIADPAADVRLRTDGEGIVAYAVSGPAALPHPDVQRWHGEIRRFYLRPDAQGAGLAGAALDELLRDLDPLGDRPVWLSVWEGNLRAQRFYARRGFREVGEHAYPVGRHLDRDLIWRRG